MELGDNILLHLWVRDFTITIIRVLNKYKETGVTCGCKLAVAICSVCDMHVNPSYITHFLSEINEAGVAGKQQIY